MLPFLPASSVNKEGLEVGGAGDVPEEGAEGGADEVGAGGIIVVFSVLLCTGGTSPSPSCGYEIFRR